MEVIDKPSSRKLTAFFGFSSTPLLQYSRPTLPGRFRLIRTCLHRRLFVRHCVQLTTYWPGLQQRLADSAKGLALPDSSAGLSHERFRVRVSFRAEEVVEFKYGQVGGTVCRRLSENEIVFSRSSLRPGGEGRNYNHRNTLKYFEDYNLSLTQRLGKIAILGQPPRGFPGK